MASLLVDRLAKLSKTHVAPAFREFDALVKAIGECKSKAEEDRILAAEVETLKKRLSDPRLDRSRGREYAVRVLYCEMLGHDVSFALIPCLQLASDPNLLTKKASFFSCAKGPCAGVRPRAPPVQNRAREQGARPSIGGRTREEEEEEEEDATGAHRLRRRRRRRRSTPSLLPPSTPAKKPTTATPTPTDPQAAYLTLTQLLDRRHDLVLLLVNTLLGDMRSDNFVVAAAALTAATRLVGPDLIGAVLPVVRFFFCLCVCVFVCLCVAVRKGRHWAPGSRTPGGPENKAKEKKKTERSLRPAPRHARALTPPHTTPPPSPLFKTTNPPTPPARDRPTDRSLRSSPTRRTPCARRPSPPSTPSCASTRAARARSRGWTSPRACARRCATATRAS